jgi:hypothetical protein
MKYTKEQLEKGMTEYYKRMNELPDEFNEVSNDFESDGKQTVEFLIDIINELNN